MNEVKYFVMMFAAFLFAIITIDSHSAGFCKDNIPGVCASSPFCVNKKIGAACRSVGTCTALGKKQVADCCSCKGGRSPRSSNVPQYESRFNNSQMLNEFNETYQQGRPQYKPQYNYPTNNKKDGFWSRGYYVEPKE